MIALLVISTDRAFAQTTDEYNQMVNRTILEYAHVIKDFHETRGMDYTFENTYIRLDLLPSNFEVSEEVVALGFQTINYRYLGRALALKEKGVRNKIVHTFEFYGPKIYANKITIGILRVWVKRKHEYVNSDSFERDWEYSCTTNKWEMVEPKKD